MLVLIVSLPAPLPDMTEVRVSYHFLLVFFALAYVLSSFLRIGRCQIVSRHTIHPRTQTAHTLLQETGTSLRVYSC